MKRLGTISEARDTLGLLDGAEVWQWIFAGKLEARRDDPARPSTWIVYQPTDQKHPQRKA